MLSAVVGGDDLGAPHVELNQYGKIVEENIIRMNQIYADMNAVHFVVMPNHVHLLLDSFCGLRGAPGSSPPTNQLSNYVAALKKFTEKEAGISLWQRGFYDHIIRDEEDYLNHIQYINENPTKWSMEKDEYYA